MSSIFNELKVVKVIRETHDSKSLYFEINPDLEEAYKYKAG